MTQQNKIALIGWDSATFDVINPLLESGHLPNLKKLIDNGTAGVLNSTIQPITPTAWTSFMTGNNPGKHGIFDFVRLDQNGNFIINSGANVTTPTLWGRFSQHNQKVLTINVPMTYPPKPVNGYLLSGMDSPDQSKAYSFPPELAAQIMEKFPNYKVGIKTKSRKGKTVEQYTEYYVQQLIEMTALRADITCHLLTKINPDLLTTIFIAPDRVQHVLGSEMIRPITPTDGIARVYIACDVALGKILDRLDESWTVFVVSDHGACAYQKVFELTTWLAQQGWLKIRQKSLFSPSIEFSRKVKRNIFRKLKLPVKQRPGLQQFKNRIIWQNTKAFALGAFGNIYINRKDRFPWGILSEQEALIVEDQITQQLYSLIDHETGTQVVKKVYRSRDIYTGSHKNKAPDLLIETHQDYFVRNNLDHEEGKIMYPAGLYKGRNLPHNGRHTSRGIIVANGPLILQNEQLQTANIIDVAPTVMYLGQMPIPNEMDGIPLTAWINEKYKSDHPIMYSDDENSNLNNPAVASYSEEESDIVTEQLRALGYLD